MFINIAYLFQKCVPAFYMQIGQIPIYTLLINFESEKENNTEKSEFELLLYSWPQIKWTKFDCAYNEHARLNLNVFLVVSMF